MSGFWDRRRAGLAAEARAEAVAEAVEVQAAREAALADKTDEELLAELDLPDPDTLQAEDDFKAFLAETVPARLRTRALRRLWRVNPVLANLDGLIEYGEDYTDAATVVENLQTTYQVGKGMLRHVEEMARQAKAAEDADNADQTAEAQLPDAATQDLADPDPTDEAGFAATAHAPHWDDASPDMDRQGVLAEAEAPAPLPAARRRMQFTFDSNEVT